MMHIVNKVSANIIPSKYNVSLNQETETNVSSKLLPSSVAIIDPLTN
jgi:hypothetical protein